MDNASNPTNPKPKIPRGPAKTPGHPKTKPAYWKTRVFFPISGRNTLSPHYCMQCRNGGKRATFGLRTTDKDEAARKAADIFYDVLMLGMDAAIEKHRPKNPAAVQSQPPVQEAAETTPTLGEWIEAAGKVFTGEQTTFGSYVRSARQIAKWIQENRSPAGSKPKLSKREQEKAEKEARKRYAAKWAAEFRMRLDIEPVTIFTRAAIQEWRKAFVDKVGNDEILKKRARISSNSILRQARSLFSEDILDTISGVTIPSPLPFDKCKYYEGEDMSYRSKIDPAVLLETAKIDLSESDLEAYKVLLLSLGAGLRRGEVDTLTYAQVNYNACIIRMEVISEGRRKTKGSEGDVPIDESLAKAIKSWQRKTRGKFVVSADGVAEAKVWGRKYRCDEVFDRAIAWLRAHGVDTMKPIHTLRKEAGSLVTTTADIQAAKQFLRHKSIAVTSAFYANNKAAHTVNLKDIAKI